MGFYYEEMNLDCFEDFQGSHTILQKMRQLVARILARAL